VGLALEQLPADFDPGPNREQNIVVYPNKLAHGDLDVIRLAVIQGRVSGPPDATLDTVVVRLLPTSRYTTPDHEGTFYFYNVREGSYEVVLDERSLPEFAVLTQSGCVPVTASPGRAPDPVTFAFQVRKPEKPVRTVILGSALPPAESKPQAEPPSVETRSAVSVAASGRGDAASHHMAGRQLTQAGRYREALTELTEAIRLDPSLAAAYNARGYAQYLLREYLGAIADLTEAIRLNPRYANAYEIRGWAKRAAGDNAGAEADVKMAREFSR
jgi:tetratricopeptide (TPR) repeat protein